MAITTVAMTKVITIILCLLRVAANSDPTEMPDYFDSLLIKGKCDGCCSAGYITNGIGLLSTAIMSSQ